MITRTAHSSEDIFDEAFLVNPWPLYRQLQEQGAIVWLDRVGTERSRATQSAEKLFAPLKSSSRAKGSV